MLSRLWVPSGFGRGPNRKTRRVLKGDGYIGVNGRTRRFTFISDCCADLGLPFSVFSCFFCPQFHPPRWWPTACPFCKDPVSQHWTVRTDQHPTADTGYNRDRSLRSWSLPNKRLLHGEDR